MSKKVTAAKIPILQDTAASPPQVETLIEEYARHGDPSDVHELIAQPLETIPFNTLLPCPLYIKVVGKFVLFRQQGDRLSARRALELEKHGVEALYLPQRFWNVFLEALEKTELPKPITPQSAATHVRSLLIAYGQEIERRAKECRKPVFDKIQQLAAKLAESLDSAPNLAKNLVKHSDDPMLYFLNHLVNVATYANLIARKLGYPKADIRMLTYATIVHDVGNLFLTKSILHKNGQVTPEEMEQLKMHPRLGAELMTEMGSPVPVVLTVLQHHERMDGKGYPQGLSGEDIHPFARICNIADVFDALTSNRPYRKALSPQDALATMGEMKGQFDPAFLSIAASVR